MANPALSQGTMTALFRRMAFFLRGFRSTREQKNQYLRSVVRYIDYDNVSTNFVAGSLVFTGVKLYQQTDSGGKLYVRFVTNVSNWDIHFYAATGAASEVARATNIAAGAAFTASAQNSSGLTVTGTLSGSITADATDKHYVRLFPSWPLQATDAFDSTDSLDGAVVNAQTGSPQTIMSAAITALNSIEQLWLNGLANCVRNQIAKEFLTSNPGGSMLSVSASADASGNVTLTVQGNAEELRATMASNTTAQTVLRVAPSAGSPVYTGNGAANASIGKGTIAVSSTYDHIKSGTLTFTCDTMAIGSETFKAVFTPSDGTAPIAAEVDLTVGGSWASFAIGISSALLSRTFTKTGFDGANLDMAAASTATVSGINPTNCPAGAYGVYIASNGSNWDVSFYRTTATFFAGDLVAKATNVATGAAFQATPTTRSGPTINWTMGSGPTATHTGTLAVNPFSSLPPADRIDVPITAAPGAWQQIWAEGEDDYLNGATSNPTIPEGFISGASNFADVFST